MPLLGATRPTQIQRPPLSRSVPSRRRWRRRWAVARWGPGGVGAMAAGRHHGGAGVAMPCELGLVERGDGDGQAVRGASRLSSWTARSWCRAIGLFQAA